MQHLWDEMQRQVCTTCIDGDAHGRCHLPVDESCVLRTQVEVVERAVRDSEGRPDRAVRVRDAVCEACGIRDAEKACWRSNRLECAFDRMLPAIIEHIDAHAARLA